MISLTRYMRMDQMSMDDCVASIQLLAPDLLTAAELEDVREFFGIKLRQWERRLFKADADAVAIKAAAPQAEGAPTP